MSDEGMGTAQGTAIEGERRWWGASSGRGAIIVLEVGESRLERFGLNSYVLKDRK